MRPPLVVVSTATEPTPGVQAFVASCRRRGVEPVLLGYGQRWRGFGWRWKLLNAVLPELLGSTLLVVDSHDSVLVRRPEELLAEHRSMGGGVVFSAEVNCWPHAEWAERFSPEVRALPYPFLNAGGVLAPAEALRALCDRFRVPELEDAEDDQAFWQECLLREPGAFSVDHEARLFQCLALAEGHAAFREGAVRNVRTGTRPAVVHGNGHSPMQEAWRWSGVIR